MSDLKRCYEILEIEPGSTYEEAKVAFRDMVSIWHPDKFPHNSRLREKAEEKLKLINGAWEQLQASFLQDRDNTVEPPRRELPEPAAVPSRVSKYRQREGKTLRADCYLTDLDCEPLIHVEQARKAYHHRCHGRHHGPGHGDETATTQNGDAGGGAGFRRQEAIVPGEGATCEQRVSGPPRQEATGEDCPRRQPDGESSRIKTADAVRVHGKGKDTVREHGAVQHAPDEGLNESGRKIKLLSDSYLLGFLERKFVNWQQREREHKKQRDAAKEIARKNKILADLFTHSFKAWLAREKSKRKGPPIIGAIFRRKSTASAESSAGKFLFGVPDISMTFVKGGAFLPGHDPRDIFAKLSGVNGEQPYRVVNVDDYYIGRYPVTVRQWSRAMGVEAQESERDLPVLLTWESAHEFISRLNEITGLKFRVPMEAEWQYAARCCGRDVTGHAVTDEMAIHGRSPHAGSKTGHHKQNDPGHIDMSGNGGEWILGITPEKTPRKLSLVTRGGAVNSGQSARGTVQRDLQGNIRVSYTIPKILKTTDKGIRFSFRLAHAAF